MVGNWKIATLKKLPNTLTSISNMLLLARCLIADVQNAYQAKFMFKSYDKIWI